MSIDRGNGLVKFLGKMPCHPSEIKIRPYILPGVFGKAETGEAAARILAYSQREDMWVGVSWGRLVEDMSNDARTISRHLAAIGDSTLWGYQKYHDDLEEYYRLDATARGTVKKPESSDYHKNIISEVISDLPNSLVGVLGIQPILSGLEALKESQLVRAGEIGVSNGIYFPSPKLVSIVMRQQSSAN